MKTDAYLNLCIEQAYLSPLHYRHGCVVVKGGKVIGQGFNDYRSGYDGGSILKSGALPKTAFPFNEGTRKKKSKKSHHNQADHPPTKPQQHQQQHQHGIKFKPVEALSGQCGGGGHHANARLSMHSEMMAINSALTSSSTLASSTVSCVKPCFKLSGDTKRKRARRAEALAAYVRAVCCYDNNTAAAQDTQQPQHARASIEAGEWRFERAAYRFFGGVLSETEAEAEESESERRAWWTEAQQQEQVQVV